MLAREVDGSVLVDVLCLVTMLPITKRIFAEGHVINYMVIYQGITMVNVAAERIDSTRVECHSLTRMSSDDWRKEKGVLSAASDNRSLNALAVLKQSQCVIQCVC